MSVTQTNSEYHGQDQLIPFLWLRRAIGLLGFIFPLILLIGSAVFGKCKGPLDSISAYYHSPMQNVFVGILCVIALFLFTYRGPIKKDSWVANFACLFCLGLAFFPTSPDVGQPDCTVCFRYEFKVLHFICATAFFLCLSFFCLFLFPKTKEGETPSPEKLKRNIVFKVCGYVMLACIILIALFSLLIKVNVIPDIPTYTFWFEWVALWAFGISWIVKGEWFLQDKS